MDKTTIIVTVLTCVLGSGGLVQYLLTRWDKRKEEENKRAAMDSAKLEALINLTCADVQDRIVRQVSRYIKAYNEDGSGITMREKAALKKMYEWYSTLGWNSLAREAMEELEEIPVIG